MHLPVGAALIEAGEGAAGTEAEVEIPLWVSVTATYSNHEAVQERAGVIVTSTGHGHPQAIPIAQQVLSGVISIAAESVKSEVGILEIMTSGREISHLPEPPP